MILSLLEVDEIAPFERVLQQTIEVLVPEILKKTVEVTEYVAPAPALTFIAIEHVFSTPDVTSAAAAPMMVRLFPLDEFAGPVYNIIEPQICNFGFDTYRNSCEVIRIRSGINQKRRSGSFIPGKTARGSQGVGFNVVIFVNANASDF